MDNINQIKVEIKNFRAINNAEIILDGITVLSGLNSTGKTTVSQLVYAFFKCTNDFEKLFIKQFLNKNKDIEIINKIVEIINIEISRNNKDVLYNIDLKKIFSNFLLNSNSFEDLQINCEFFKRVYEELIDKLKIGVENSNQFIFDFERIYKYLEFEIKEKNMEIKINNLHDVFIYFFNTLELNISKLKDDYINRPNDYLKMFLEEYLHFQKFPQKFIVQEFGSNLVNLSEDENAKIGLPNLVRNVVYIDTPKSYGINDEKKIWNDLNSYLKKKEINIEDNYSEILNIIKDLIKGNAKYDNNNFGKHFVFTRDDNKSFDLLEVASGIQAISILQFLLKNGSINKYTLICIDEPEIHLHPQWIVEYARILVLIHKKIGARFLIASHHAEFISAIKYICLKEEVQNNCNFYVTELSSKKFQYNFKHLGLNIEQIFSNFNIAFNKIDTYGKYDD